MTSRDIVAIVTALTSLGVAATEHISAVSAKADTVEVAETMARVVEATVKACNN